MELYNSRYRWVMLGLAWLMYFVFGVVITSVAPLATQILDDLGISYSEIGIIMGFWMMPYVLLAGAAGVIIDRWGLRKSLFLGVMIIALSEGLRYFASGFVSLLLSVALFGLGGPMVSLGSPKIISVWFGAKSRGLAVGIYMTGPVIGGLVAYAMINSLVMPLAGYSWRLTFVYLSLLPFIVAWLSLVLARDARPARTETDSGFMAVLISLIRAPGVKPVLAMGFLTLATLHGFNNWLPAILEAGGLPVVTAGFMASIPSLVAILAVSLIPGLIPSSSRGHSVALLCIVRALAVMAIVSLPGNPMIIGLVVYGLCVFTVTPLLMLMLMETPGVGSKHMGAAAGLFFSVANIGGVIGPFIVGGLKDLTGGFLAGASFIAIMSLGISVMARLVKTRPAADQGATPYVT